MPWSIGCHWTRRAAFWVWYFSNLTRCLKSLLSRQIHRDFCLADLLSSAFFLWCRELLIWQPRKRVTTLTFSLILCMTPLMRMGMVLLISASLQQVCLFSAVAHLEWKLLQRLHFTTLTAMDSFLFQSSKHICCQSLKSCIVSNHPLNWALVFQWKNWLQWQHAMLSKKQIWIMMVDWAMVNSSFGTSLHMVVVSTGTTKTPLAPLPRLLAQRDMLFLSIPWMTSKNSRVCKKLVPSRCLVLSSAVLVDVLSGRWNLTMLFFALLHGLVRMSLKIKMVLTLSLKSQHVYLKRSTWMQVAKSIRLLSRVVCLCCVVVICTTRLLQRSHFTIWMATVIFRNLKWFHTWRMSFALCTVLIVVQERNLQQLHQSSWLPRQLVMLFSSTMWTMITFCPLKNFNTGT